MILAMFISLLACGTCAILLINDEGVGGVAILLLGGTAACLLNLTGAALGAGLALISIVGGVCLHLWNRRWGGS